MPRPWFRKRGEKEPEPPEPAPEEVEDVRLDGDEHAWWTQGEVNEVWKPRQRRVAAQEEEKRDILAEHFGDDWRTSFEFTPPTPEELAEQRRREQQLINDGDPYMVLGVAPTATWEEIVVAHRDMARLHHPDLLFGQSEEEKAEGEDRIRVINTAYQELRVRRGK